MRNAKVATLGDGGGAVAEAGAARGERFAAVGGEAEVMRLTGEGTGVADAGGLRVIPGLNDSHLHAIRGGLHFNLELRWDGVDSLARGLEMIREQADRTPQGQWARVMGGWWRGRSTRRRYFAPTGRRYAPDSLRQTKAPRVSLRRNRASPARECLSWPPAAARAIAALRNYPAGRAFA